MSQKQKPVLLYRAITTNMKSIGMSAKKKDKERLCDVQVDYTWHYRND